MEFRTTEKNDFQPDQLLDSPEQNIAIARQHLYYFSEKICRDKDCRYPQLALRILIYIVAGMNADGKIHISARRLSQTMCVHYDTVTKCLKYLRQIEVICR